MIACILGRQPELGFAELSSLYADATLFSDTVARINVDWLDIQMLGGTQKAGRIIQELPFNDWPRICRAVMKHYSEAWRQNEQKITFGISVYGSANLRPGDVNRLSLQLKQSVKQTGTSIRQIANKTVELNTAVSHHNKLGLHPRKIEIIIIIGKKTTLLTESIGAQNITALARRDQERPKRDAFVGMLPPKLALMMVNMAIGQSNPKTAQLLDPFCGTGVVLQEAYLRGLTAHGSDLNPKMVDFTKQNLAWLTDTHITKTGAIGTVEVGDAMKHTWAMAKSITHVVCETYLGQPFSATPSPAKLREVQKNCQYIISSSLENLAKQVSPGTTFCVAVPAWRNLATGAISRLPLTSSLQKSGYATQNTRPLLYFREDQVVARDILLLTKQ